MHICTHIPQTVTAERQRYQKPNTEEKVQPESIRVPEVSMIGVSTWQILQSLRKKKKNMRRRGAGSLTSVRAREDSKWLWNGSPAQPHDDRFLLSTPSVHFCHIYLRDGWPATQQHSLQSPCVCFIHAGTAHHNSNEPIISHYSFETFWWLSFLGNDNVISRLQCALAHKAQPLKFA